MFCTCLLDVLFVCREKRCSINRQDNCSKPAQRTGRTIVPCLAPKDNCPMYAQTTDKTVVLSELERKTRLLKSGAVLCARKSDRTTNVYPVFIAKHKHCLQRPRTDSWLSLRRHVTIHVSGVINEDIKHIFMSVFCGWLQQQKQL